MGFIMNANTSFSERLRRANWVVIGIAIFQFALHTWVNAHDTFFRDELYYMAAGQHLDLGYLDVPPLVAWLTALSRAMLGSSVVAIRLLAAIAGVLYVLITASITAELGGNRAAQGLAAVCVALGPVFLGTSGLMGVDTYSMLAWFAAAWVLVRLIKRQEPRLWLLFGVVTGLGMLNKVTMAYYGFALVIGLLLTPQRKLLFSRWLLLGGAIALIIFSPYIIWEVMHGFPTLEFWKIYAAGKTFPVTPLEFFLQQLPTTNIFAVPIWLAGLYYLFFTEEGKPFRSLGWAYLILYVIFTIQQAKFYFLSPAYPALFAGGACALQKLVQQRPKWRWLQPTAFRTILITSLIMVPFSIPILSPEDFIRINGLFGNVGDIKSERLAEGLLPQNYADRYGWREMTSQIAQVYNNLPPDDKKVACILTSDYGQAGAVDFYGPALGLPKAISGHNSYYIWGPDGCTGKVIISVGIPASDLQTGFNSVQPAGKVQCTYCMPYENGSPIIVSRGLKLDLKKAWPSVKNYS
jgi:hypothetical protein